MGHPDLKIGTDQLVDLAIRIPRSSRCVAVLDALLPAIIEQKVTGQEAFGLLGAVAAAEPRPETGRFGQAGR